MPKTTVSREKTKEISKHDTMSKKQREQPIKFTKRNT